MFVACTSVVRHPGGPFPTQSGSVQKKKHIVTSATSKMLSLRGLQTNPIIKLHNRVSVNFFMASLECMTRNLLMSKIFIEGLTSFKRIS